VLATGRPFFALAHTKARARRTALGKAPAPISPLALEVVRRAYAIGGSPKNTSDPSSNVACSPKA
jgi:hypothetical protein